MPTLSLQGRKINYRVVNSKNRNYVYLKFRPDLTLDILLPTKKVDADEVIRKKESWILKKYDDLASSKKVFNDEKVMYRGKYLKPIIDRAEHSSSKRPLIQQNNLILYSNGEATLKDLIRRWFTEETSKYLRRTLPKLARFLATQYDKADVKEMRKWGYCNRNGMLSFSWQLIALPRRLRDYVVLHELVHLSEFSHSNRFHKKLASICPDYKQREIELKHIVPM